MAEPIEADNILKRLKTLKATESMFQGLDLKVKPKEKHSNIDLKNTSTNDALQKNGQDAYDRIRKKSTFGLVYILLYMSILYISYIYFYSSYIFIW